MSRRRVLFQRCVVRGVQAGGDVVAAGGVGSSRRRPSHVAAAGVGSVEEEHCRRRRCCWLSSRRCRCGEARCCEGEKREGGGNRHRRGPSSPLRGGAPQGRGCERTLGTQAGLGRHVDLRVRRAEPSLPWSIRNPWQASDGFGASLSPEARGSRDDRFCFRVKAEAPSPRSWGVRTSRLLASRATGVKALRGVPRVPNVPDTAGQAGLVAEDTPHLTGIYLRGHGSVSAEFLSISGHRDSSPNCTRPQEGHGEPRGTPATLRN